MCEITRGDFEIIQKGKGAAAAAAATAAADEARSRDGRSQPARRREPNEWDVSQGEEKPPDLQADCPHPSRSRLQPTRRSHYRLHSTSRTYEADTTLRRGRHLVKGDAFLASAFSSPRQQGVRQAPVASVCHATKVGWVGEITSGKLSSGLEADQPTNAARGVSSLCSPNYVADVGSASNSLRESVDASPAAITGSRPIVCISLPTTPPLI